MMAFKDAFEAALKAKDELAKYDPADFPEISEIFPLTDLGNAKRFVHMHQRNIRYVREWKAWMVWNKQRWVNKDDAGIIPLVDEMIRNMEREARGMSNDKDATALREHTAKIESEHHIMACIRLAKGQPEIIAKPDDFDKNKYFINVMNGTIDLLGEGFREFRREDMMTQMANVTYDENAKAPVWDAFLKRIMRDDAEMISFLQRAAGYALTGDGSEECIFMLYGTGANGKSKFIDALAFMLGEYARKTAIHTVIEMKNESALSSDIASLKGVRFAYASEPNKGKRLDEGKIKDVTGREKISCCRKYCEPEEYQPQFKLFISFNHKPVIKSVDEGIHRRIRFIPFDVKIPDAEKDTTLDVKLHAETSGILNWALEGVKAWNTQRLGFPEKAREATDTYFDEMDALGEFLEVCCDVGKEYFVSFQILYSYFLLWCEYKHIYKMSDKAFAQALNERDITSHKYQGVRIKRGCQLNAKLSSVQLSIDNGLLEMDYLTDVDRLFAIVSPIYITPPTNPINTSNASNASIDSGIVYNTQSVQPVQSVNIIDTLLIKIKQLFAEKYKPENIQDLNKLKELIKTEIESDYDFDQYADETIIKYINDYSKVLGYG